MIRVIYILIFLIGLHENVLSQTKEKNEKKEYKDTPENYKTLISIGVGYDWSNNSKSNLIFSFDFIPKISRKVFLDFKIDGIKQGQSYNTLLNIIPEYKLDFDNNSKLSGYFGIGPTIFFYPKGHLGLDASITCQAKIQYSLKSFFMNAEIRKPIFFYEDSGHIDFLLCLNFGIKI